jgi:hypothetical protein
MLTFLGMTRYELFLFLHIACVIVWLGAGTTVAVLSQRVPISEHAQWLGPRVFAPASLGSLAFGLALVFEGHWTFSPLWIQLALGAFALSTLLNVGVRFPIFRSNAPDRDRKLGALARVELAVLYLAVADMVAKPTGDDVAALAVGGALLGFVALASVTQLRIGRTAA